RGQGASFLGRLLLCPAEQIVRNSDCRSHMSKHIQQASVCQLHLEIAGEGAWLSMLARPEEPLRIKIGSLSILRTLMLNSFSRLRLSKDAYCALILLVSSYCLAQKMNDAGSRAASVLDSMPQTRQIDQVAISPDGSRVAYVTGAAVSVVPASGG